MSGLTCSLDSALARVRKFHEVFDRPRPDRLTFPAESVLRRVRLAFEEFIEMLYALGVPDPELLVSKLLDESEKLPHAEITLADVKGEVDPVAVADALADKIVIDLGSAVEWGIPVAACFDEVMNSNMTKLGADGKPMLREDGKIMKGPNYRPPRLSPLLFPSKQAA